MIVASRKTKRKSLPGNLYFEKAKPARDEKKRMRMMYEMDTIVLLSKDLPNFDITNNPI